LKCITNRDPRFLKEAYREELDLVPHAGWIEPQERYIEWTGDFWLVLTMTIERVPRFFGRYPTCKRAIFYGSR
jgi:hypothetical protein